MAGWLSEEPVANQDTSASCPLISFHPSCAPKATSRLHLPLARPRPISSDEFASQCPVPVLLELCKDNASSGE
jgi:hypothetical protein